MFVVDTNVLIYAADVRAPEHERCSTMLDTWRRQNGAWYLTWGICYEFLRVVTHSKVFRNPWTADKASQFIFSLRESPGLDMLIPTERHDSVLEEVISETPLLNGNIFHDAETAVLMKEHGIRRIVTRDTDFHRFGFVEPIDPLTFEP